MHHVLLTIVGERRDKNFESNSKFFKEKMFTWAWWQVVWWNVRCCCWIMLLQANEDDDDDFGVVFIINDDIIRPNIFFVRICWIETLKFENENPTTYKKITYKSMFTCLAIQSDSDERFKKNKFEKKKRKKEKRIS